MTPLIRDVCRIRFPGQMPFASVRGAHYFFTIILLLIAVSCMAVAAPPQSQDPSAKPAPVPVAQQSSTPASNPYPHHSTEQTPLQKAVHQKKVITEDDLAKPAKVISLDDLEGEENNPTCDLSCEAELRAQLGFGPEREAELQAASGYCDIKRQIEKIVGKGVGSEYIRNDVHSRFADREGKLSSQYRNSAGLLTQRIQVVQRFAPFRATVMQYQWNEATARVCPDYTLP